MENKSWLEIIGVRLFALENQSILCEIFKEVTLEKYAINDQGISAQLYENSMVKTDWAIYLYQSRLHGLPCKTSLGLNIAEAFSSLGLVNHSVWSMNTIKKEI